MFSQKDTNSTSAPKKIIQIRTHDYFERNSSINRKAEQQVQQKDIDTVEKQLESVKEKQKELVERTRNEIERERENWRIEKDAWMEEAKEIGYQEGFSAGERKALAQYKESLEQINAIVDRANEDYHTMIAKSDETIVDLAILVAEKILKQKITEDPSSFLLIVKAAIKELQDQSVITIYVHPDNFPILLDHKQELSQMLEDNRKLSVYVKEEIDIDSCIIEHPFGQIDASLDTQLSQIRQILQDVVQENTNG